MENTGINHLQPTQNVIHIKLSQLIANQLIEQFSFINSCAINNDEEHLIGLGILLNKFNCLVLCRRKVSTRSI